MKYKDMKNSANTGLCCSCGQSTTLNIHQKCGDKFINKPEKVRKKKVFKNKTCASVDCNEEFTPESASQKLCPACTAMVKAARRKRYNNSF